MEKYRVIQWGTGYTGVYSLRYILGNKNLELVGVKCFTDEKVGKDAGEFCDFPSQGVTATNDRDSILAMKADCVVFMPQDYLSDPSIPANPLTPWLEDMIAILESGKNIITPLCSGTHWKHMKNGESFRNRLNEACEKGGTTVVFSGFDPGFTTDALAYTVSSVAGEISQIRTWEIIDVSTYTATHSLNALGLGVRPEDLPKEGGDAITVGWAGALYLLADAFGVDVESTKQVFDISLASEAYTTSGGLFVDKGTIDAVRWELSALVKGKPLFSINHVTRACDDAAPDWPRIGRDGGYRIEMDSFPPFLGDFPMGLPGGTGSTFADAMAMTAARCVNSIDKVVLANSGYLTFLDLSPLGGSGGTLALTD